MEYLYLIINTLLYCFLLFFLYKKSNKSKEIILLLGLWILVSIVSIFFRNSPIYYFVMGNHYNAHQKSITLLPFIYLFILFVIYSYPFSKFNSQSIKRVVYNYSFINYLTIVIGICGYLPFIENTLHLIYGGNSLSYVAQAYGTGTIAYRSHMSFLGARLNSVLELTAIVNPILLFLYLNKNEKNIIIAVGLIFAVLNMLVVGFTEGSRGVAISSLIQIIYVYLLVQNTLGFKIKKFISSMILSITATITMIALVITIFRFSDTTSLFSEFSVVDWILLYAGESFCNFNTDMWAISHFTGSANCFADLSLYGEIRARDIAALADITKVRMHVFYTGFGDLYADFGRLGTVIIIIFLCFSLCLIKLKKNTMFLSDFILLVLYGRFLVLGMFFFPYITSYRTLVVSLILVIFLKLFKS